MKRAIIIVAACAMLLWHGTALARATPHTPQQNCDYARITAWKVYVSCMNTVLARDAKWSPSWYAPYPARLNDEFTAFAKCRHTYFKKWTNFQTKATLVGSACVGDRFTDNGDETVTDNLSALVWEKKQDLDGTQNYSDPHDADNTYRWSASYASGGREDGTAFTDFLGTVNSGAGFAGSNGWRLPTLVELETTILDFACTGAARGPRCNCPVVSPAPCVDPELDAANTQADYYWSSTTFFPSPLNAWVVTFSNLYTDASDKTNVDHFHVRAVRGGF